MALPGDRYSEASFTGTNQNASFMSFQYYGTRVAIVGARRWNHGQYQVTIDGQLYPEGNGNALPDLFQQNLFVESLTQRLHSVQIMNKEDAWLDIDQASTSYGTDC
jgi:hypothetical protein